MLYLNSAIDAINILRQEGLSLCVGTQAQAPTIALLNLMPKKQTTEVDFCRMLAQADMDLNLLLLKIPGQQYKNTAQTYVDTHYLDMDDHFFQSTTDGLIITGAPLENLAFEEVRYWNSLCQLMEWSKTAVKSTLNICWAAQAALYYHEEVPKYPLPNKKFGIFTQQNLQPQHPLLYGLGYDFPMPHSRHTTVRQADFPLELQVLAAAQPTGMGIAVNPTKRQVYVTGHLEYAADTLHKEYLRDFSRNLPISPAENYYENDNPELPIRFSWRETALTFYRNWLNTLTTP